MSKKDLLERLNRASDTRSTRRTATEADGAARPRAEAVTTRVSKSVMRRRRKKKPAPAETTPEMTPEAAQNSTPETTTAEAAPAARRVVRRSAEAPVAESPPMTAESAADKSDSAPTDPAPAARARQEAATSDSEATPQAAAPARSEPASQQDAPAAKTVEPQAAAETAQADARQAAPASGDVAKVPAKAASPAEPQPKERPEQARFAGLGKAVVMPPPGYDPTNPSAYRRRIANETAAAAAAGTPAGDSARRGRRRVEAGAAAPAAARPERGKRGRRTRAGGGGRGGRPPGRTHKRRRRSSGPKTPSPTPKAIKRKVRVHNVITVRDLAGQLGLKAGVIIKTLMKDGMMVTMNDVLDLDTATLIASEFDYTVENVGFQEENFLQHVEEEEEETEPRPPIVTVMGHVDHGKTTLLDAIRETRVVHGEAGGITQHIGAYQVELDEDEILTFIDTPGHAAFTAMRARGADITDIVVLVVAADDGVQPQTEEAINHAKAAEVPIIVAINKMDKPGVSPDSIKQQLGEFGLVPEEWGGETLFVPVSALRGDGIDELLEAISLQAEILDLSANAERHAEGVVIEAKMEQGKGAVATVLVQTGTLRRGDHVVMGHAYGRVRAMLDHRGKRTKAAGPSTPVEVFGISDLPEVGDSVSVVENEKNARKLSDHRSDAKREAALNKTRRRTAEDLFAAASADETEHLNLIIKADVAGSLQAIKSSIDAIEVNGTEVRLLHTGVGPISESDVNLAAVNDATLIAFDVKTDAKARGAADHLGVTVHEFKVIYGVLDFVEANMKGLLAPTFEEVRQGTAEVRAVFNISRFGRVAGCYVLDGKIGRNSIARVLRDGKEIFKGKITTLKRFKDDVKEVTSGFECGLGIADFNEIEEGDLVESLALVEVERT